MFIVRTKEGNKVLLVLGQKTGVHRENLQSFTGLENGVFIVRTKEGNKVLLVLGQKTGLGSEDQCVHRED